MQVRMTEYGRHRHFLHGCSEQTVFRGYQDEIVTGEDIYSELVNSLLLETVHREALRGAAKVWALYGGLAPYSHIFRL